MEHQHEEKEINLKALYYIIGLLTGIVTGFIINGSIVLMITLGITGLLFTALFLNVFVRGREER
jgi:hypothetical protein